MVEITRAMVTIQRCCSACGALESEEHRSSCITLLDDRVPVYRTEEIPVPGVHNIEVAIPPEVAQYAPDIQRFVDAMVFKLSVNAHKGKWEDRGQAVNMGLLQKEVVELTEAINRGNMVEIMLEAADVANFALIASAIAMDKK